MPMQFNKPAVTTIFTERTEIDSAFLEREVLIDAYLPVNIPEPEKMSLLLINDGQDLPKMPFEEILGNLIENGEIEPLVCIGIHCGPERKMEYGVAGHPDFKGRGAKADLYTKFIFEELLPLIRKMYYVHSFKEKSFAGFSLGALSAMDIVWNHPAEFSKAGVFSGSLWWRNKGYDEGYDESKDRIMHSMVRGGDDPGSSNFYPWLKFFFECGAGDEGEDRNKNGIIDSIDDTLDLIAELKAKGYSNNSIKYLELASGKHDVPTWGQAFPEFLKWGWGKQ